MARTAKAVTKKDIQAMTGLGSSAVNNHIKRYPEVFEVVGKTGKTLEYKAAPVKKHFKQWSNTSAAKTVKKKPKVKAKTRITTNNNVVWETDNGSFEFKKDFVSISGSRNGLLHSFSKYWYTDIRGVTLGLLDENDEDDYCGIRLEFSHKETVVRLSENNNDNAMNIYEEFVSRLS